MCTEYRLPGSCFGCSRLTIDVRYIFTNDYRDKGDALHVRVMRCTAHCMYSTVT